MVVADSLPPAAAVRAKRLARKPALEARHAERLRRERLLAVALDTVLRAHGVPNTTVAEWFDCAEVVVRDLLKRKAPLRAMHVYQLPEHIRAATFELLSRLLAPLPECLRAPPANDVAPDSSR